MKFSDLFVSRDTTISAQAGAQAVADKANADLASAKTEAHDADQALAGALALATYAIQAMPDGTFRVFISTGPTTYSVVVPALPTDDVPAPPAPPAPPEPSVPSEPSN